MIGIKEKIIKRERGQYYTMLHLVIVFLSYILAFIFKGEVFPQWAVHLITDAYFVVILLSGLMAMESGGGLLARYSERMNFRTLYFRSNSPNHAHIGDNSFIKTIRNNNYYNYIVQYHYEGIVLYEMSIYNFDEHITKIDMFKTKSDMLRYFEKEEHDIIYI